MSTVIKVVGKDVMDVDTEKYVAVSLSAYDGTTKLNNGIFVETESLAEACAGITEYGLLVFNTVNSDTSDSVTVSCSVDGTLTSATTTLADILDADIGDALGG